MNYKWMQKRGESMKLLMDRKRLQYWLRCAVQCLAAQSWSTFCDPRLQAARLLCPWRFFRQEYWSGLPYPPVGDHPNPGIKSKSPTLQTNSLPSEPPAKPKNTGVGSLSFLQGIFLTQESNQGLLHCRWILYQLSYQGSPVLALYFIK